MARRKQSGLDVIASMPWPWGVALGLAAYFGIRYGIGWYFSGTGGPLMKTFGQQATNGIFAPLAWMALILCWLAALVSYGRQHTRRQLLHTQRGLDSLRSINWREFEMLVGEAFRRQGFRVEETGLGGADGGIDLILEKGGRTTLVQCKQWKSRQVNVSTVREMWGLVAHHRADAVKIVCANTFTADAARFADGKPIELISGQALVELINSVRSCAPTSHDRVEPTFSETPACPRCESPMIERRNRASGESFWGCPSYPKCKGTRTNVPLPG